MQTNNALEINDFLQLQLERVNESKQQLMNWIFQLNDVYNTIIYQLIQNQPEVQVFFFNSNASLLAQLFRGLVSRECSKYLEFMLQFANSPRQLDFYLE